MKGFYKIHKEGYKIILAAIILLSLINLVSFKLIQLPQTVVLSIAAISLTLLAFVVLFFRIPYRVLEQDDNSIIAPADGKVVVIEEVFEDEYFQDKRIQVSIFMSPTNVHVNRNPIGGLVKYVKYHPGKYLVAWHPKSSKKNEHNSVVIGNNEFDVLIRQIAGKLARRIVNYNFAGDTVEQGDELGFIKFGSRVDLLLPIGTTIEVNLKEKVKGGKTIIGILPD